MSTTDPRVSPLYGKIAGLPPILMQVGTNEMLLDDARRFGDRAREFHRHERCESRQQLAGT